MEEHVLCRLAGVVEPGHRLGRRLGFPTANLVLHEEYPVLSHGVYAALAQLPDGSAYPAVTNIGVRPTVERAGALWAESYLIGFSGDLYGKPIRLSLCRYLRPERRFDSIEELRAAIAENVAETKALFQKKSDIG